VLIENGRIKKIGETEEMIDFYLKSNLSSHDNVSWNESVSPGLENIKFLKVFINKKDEILYMSSEFTINFKLFFKEPIDNMSLTFHLLNEYENVVFGSGSVLTQTSFEKGTYEFSCKIPANLMNSGSYTVNALIVHNSKIIYKNEGIISFDVADKTSRKGWYGKLAGIVRPQLEWNLIKTQNEA
jgi:lipopolysaccharide transport system ATP-binding protein